jgi:hypothetical protein
MLTINTLLKDYKNISLYNLKWWEDPYTFACLELKSFLSHKTATWDYNQNIAYIKNKYPNADILIANGNIFAKLNEYMIIYIDSYDTNLVQFYYNEEFKSEKNIDDIIQEMKNFI